MHRPPRHVVVLVPSHFPRVPFVVFVLLALLSLKLPTALERFTQKASRTSTSKGLQTKANGGTVHANWSRSCVECERLVKGQPGSGCSFPVSSQCGVCRSHHELSWRSSRLIRVGITERERQLTKSLVRRRRRRNLDIVNAHIL